MTDGGSADGIAKDSPSWDFFVSYTEADQAWAEWISWQLEEAGYRVLVQVWDFVVGTNWQVRMQQGVQRAERTVAVLSNAYLSSVYGQAEWQAAHAADPHGFGRKLLPMRVENCPRPGLLGAVVSIDLFTQNVDHAGRHLLHHVRQALAGRAKPTTPPTFPEHRLKARVGEPAFPAGEAGAVHLSSAPVDRLGLENLLVRQRRALGVDHPDALETAHQLGCLLGHLGDHLAARTVLDDTLAYRRRTLGLDELDTLDTAHQLGRTLGELGDHDLARPILEDTLARRHRALGHNHPDTLGTAHRLAWAMTILGDHAAARPLIEETLARKRLTFGQDHPETYRSVHLLGRILVDLGDHAVARPLLEDALAHRRRTLGPDHASTLWTASRLGWSLLELGDQAEARTLLEDTLFRYQRTRGQHSSDALRTAVLLKQASSRLGKWDPRRRNQPGRGLSPRVVAAPATPDSTH